MYIASHPRRTCDSSSSPISIPSGIAAASHSPYTLPSSVSRKSFPCHSYANCWRVYQQFPFWLIPSAAGGSARHWIQVLSFHTVAHSFALFCTFLHLCKTQLFSFQAIPHSLRKTPGVWGGVHTGSRTDGKKEGEVRGQGGDANGANSSQDGRGSRAPITCFPCSSHNLRYNSMPRVAVRVVPL